MADETSEDFLFLSGSWLSEATIVRAAIYRFPLIFTCLILKFDSWILLDVILTLISILILVLVQIILDLCLSVLSTANDEMRLAGLEIGEDEVEVEIEIDVGCSKFEVGRRRRKLK